MNYQEFIENKKRKSINSGFEIDKTEFNNALFEYQKDITQTALKKGNYAVFADCGLGKTLIEIEWAKQVNKYTNKPVLIFAPLEVCSQTIDECKKFNYDFEIKYAEDEKDIENGIYISNYDRADKFNGNNLGGVILDECFAPDTKIQVVRDKKLHNVNIKDCQIGDYVLNCNGIDKIKAVKKKKVEYAIKIGFNGKEIICSPRHPFFTQRGWVPAKEIQKTDFIISSDKAMRILRGEFSNNLQIGYEEKILQSILLSEMENEPSRDKSASAYQGSTQENRSKEISMVQNTTSEKRIGTNTKFEPNEEFRNSEKSIIETQGDETQTFSAWGQWSGDDITSAINEGCVVRELDSGICYITGKASKGLSDELQSRFSKLREKSCNRIGWKLTLCEKELRQKEGRETGYYGVESFEVLELGCSELDKYRDEKGQLYFYDLTIEQHPSFTINECLVHNSSILKNYTGATKRLLIEKFSNVLFKLCATATPSPNDNMEILNQSEFLGVIKSTEALSEWFINDTMNFGGYRLKQHAKDDFYRWLCSWSVSIDKPSDLGYSDEGFKLPELNIDEIVVSSNNNQNTDGKLFRVPETLNATNFNKEKRMSLENRLKWTMEKVNNSKEQWLIWCETNEEADILSKNINDSFEIRGATPAKTRLEKVDEFKKRKLKVLISKPSIFGYGLNFQNCNNTIFFGLSFSYESFYQSIKRFHRFGQTLPVNAYIVIGENEKSMLNIITEKKKQHLELKENMAKNIRKYQDLEYGRTKEFKINYDKKEYKTQRMHLINGDCVEEITYIPDESIDFSIFSPPFSSLYIYSDSYRDMGNCKNDDEFIRQFEYLIPELYRILRTGRLVAVHCKQLVNYAGTSGKAGLRDFRGDLIRAFLRYDFAFHSEVFIWKDPVIEMQRTKAQGLLYKQLRKDSSYSRVGMPEYLLLFRKWGDRTKEIPVDWKTKQNFELPKWQDYASPCWDSLTSEQDFEFYRWMDIQQTNVLNGKVAKENADEKHICPLQLDVIERAIEMWTNPDEVVFTPFLGIGSEIYQALKMGRRGIGIELKESYFNQAIKYCNEAANSQNQLSLF